MEVIIRKFLDGGKRGGYVAATGEAERSTLKTAGPPKPLPGGFLFPIEAAQVSPTAYQLLRNMAACENVARPLVAGILVRDLGPGRFTEIELPLPEEDTEDELYPGLSKRLDFKVEWEDLPFRKLRRCLVEFARPLSPEQVGLVREYVRPWMDLVEAGAFCLPATPPEEGLCVGGTVGQFDEVTVEITVNHFMGSETAWNVLLNRLQTLARSALPVARVVVE